MYWGSDRSDKPIPPSERPLRKEVLDVLQQIEALSVTTMHTNATTNAELGALYAKLADMRKGCDHYWETVFLLRFHKRFCKVCDMEDPAYRHDGIS